MYLAVELGNIDLNPVLKGALATILYFLVGIAVLVIGFLMVDVLTPGKLRQLVFIDRRPNAVVLPARCTSRWPPSSSARSPTATANSARDWSAWRCMG